jgi:hypothetical protein
VDLLNRVSTEASNTCLYALLQLLTVGGLWWQGFNFRTVISLCYINGFDLYVLKNTTDKNAVISLHFFKTFRPFNWPRHVSAMRTYKRKLLQDEASPSVWLRRVTYSTHTYCSIHTTPTAIYPLHVPRYTYYTYRGIHTTPTTVYILHIPRYTYYTYHVIRTTPTAV